ncbi:MAG: transposase zinc-binding domain-containing protein [Cyclobacteriaceae bacterium]
MARPKHELADVIRLYGGQFIQHQPLKQHQRTLNAIAVCRTAALGGHIDRCNDCGHERTSYNSCRNRHCPKCQGTNRERWVLERQEDLLPVPYFHVVFTLPEQLNALCLSHPRQLYTLLFQASRQTVMQLGDQDKRLGADMGMISVLHTWASNCGYILMCILSFPVGGLASQAIGSSRPAGGSSSFLSG